MHCHGDSLFPCSSQDPMNQPSDKQSGLNSIKDLPLSTLIHLFVAVSLERILWAFLSATFLGEK